MSAQILPGFSIASPVTVTTRSMRGLPEKIASAMAKQVPTLCIITPTSTGNPCAGTSLLVNTWMSCFSPPAGYLVGIIHTR